MRGCPIIYDWPSSLSVHSIAFDIEFAFRFVVVVVTLAHGRN